jgi:hypothetical protein
VAPEGKAEVQLFEERFDGGDSQLPGVQCPPVSDNVFRPIGYRRELDGTL